MILLTFTALLFAAAEPRSVTTTISAIEGDAATVPVGDIPTGVSGIVLHHYDQTHAAIVASVSVIASDHGSTRLKLLPFKGLAHPKLPDIKTKPQKGDTVILGYLYDRVLPIVPNQLSLEHARESFPRLHIIHPDLVAAELAKEKSPMPSKEILQKSCEKFNLGIVMIMFSDGTDFLDCISWVQVGHADVTAVEPEKFKQPFFNRFGEIPTAFYDWGEYHIENFDRYYRKLEREK
jgi:hypothetical protein